MPVSRRCVAALVLLSCAAHVALAQTQDAPAATPGGAAVLHVEDVPDRWDLSVRLDGDAIGQLHDQRPAVVQLPVPEHPVHVFDPVHHISGRASCLLQERHIHLTFAGHLHQFAPRLLALADVPAHDLDHPTTAVSTLSPRRLGDGFIQKASRVLG